MSYAEVVPDTRSLLPRDAYTYAVPGELEERVVPGARVEVPFGTRSLVGFVLARSAKAEFDDARDIVAVLDEQPLLLRHHIALAHWIAQRYCAPLGEVIRAMVPAGVRSVRPGGRKRGPRTVSRAVEAAREAHEPGAAPPLTAAQRAAVSPLLEAIAAQRHRRVLLHGVTGSGKTEVYLTAIDAALRQQRRAIVLVPEIALTPQTVERFAKRFPGRVALLHSGLSEAERAREWLQIRAGAFDVVVGSRSAVFAPVEGLGIVVVDEEDSSAYKQDRVPRYHAVETALELGRLASAPVVLGSATPRVETFYRAHAGDLELVSLPRRVTGRGLPGIAVVDLREELRAGNTHALSKALTVALDECHAAGGQSILFLNRRGMATVVLCRSCGFVLNCGNCSVALVHHLDRDRCDCHYCGLSAPLPATCPACGSRAIRGLGMGTERLEHEVRDRFPNLRLLRMDRDTTQSRDAYYEIYDRFRNHEADCLIGTQMLAKGWDMGNVRVVGIVNADTALHFPDYRSGETTFALLTQVAGRAGRGDEPARVVLQTYNPEHYAVRHATTHDYLGFAREEIRVRRALRFPPYARLVVCTYTHRRDAKAEVEARRRAQELSDTLAGGDGLDILGPTPAFLHRLRGQYRWQITVRGQAIEKAFPHLPKGKGWAIDVDPAA
jgi:primosomal protein N' (replication factor Y) (superfamily II helicase)